VTWFETWKAKLSSWFTCRTEDKSLQTEWTQKMQKVNSFPIHQKFTRHNIFSVASTWHSADYRVTSEKVVLAGSSMGGSRKSGGKTTTSHQHSCGGEQLDVITDNWLPWHMQATQWRWRQSQSCFRQNTVTDWTNRIQCLNSNGKTNYHG